MAKVYFIAATLMILQGLVFCFVQPTHFSNFCSFDNGTYNMSWMYNATSDKLYFVVEVAAVGWVGFGLASNAPTNMKDYDVAVGGVYNGTGYLKDYLTVGRVQPRLDTQKDWYLTYSSEVDNVTTLKFHRMRNTSDSNDTAVQQGESIYVIWAYHYTDDVNLTTWSFNKHSQKGFQSKILIPATGVITYKPKSGECDRVCCNGPGGALTVEGSCSPTDKCAGIKPADKQETGHCPGESKDTCKCGSEGFMHNSNFALIILLGIASFMKNTF